MIIHSLVLPTTNKEDNSSRNTFFTAAQTSYMFVYKLKVMTIHLHICISKFHWSVFYTNNKNTTYVSHIFHIRHIKLIFYKIIHHLFQIQDINIKPSSVNWTLGEHCNTMYVVKVIIHACIIIQTEINCWIIHTNKQKEISSCQDQGWRCQENIT